GHAGLLFGDLLGGERGGVAAGGLAGAAEVDFEEFGTEGFDLFLDDGAGVEGFDARAEAFGGGDDLEAGDARADDKHAGGHDGAGGGHHHGQDAAEAGGGLHDGSVAGEVGLRAERVHFLREGGARDHFQADGAGLGGGELLEEGGLVEGVEEAEVDGVGFEAGDVFSRGFADAEHEVGFGEGGGVVGRGLGPGGGVVGVRIAAGDAEAGGEAHVEAELHEGLGGGGGERGAGFGRGFGGCVTDHRASAGRDDGGGSLGCRACRGQSASR